MELSEKNFFFCTNLQVRGNISSCSDVVSRGGVGLRGKEGCRNDVGRGKQNTGCDKMRKSRRSKGEEDTELLV